MLNIDSIKDKIKYITQENLIEILDNFPNGEVALDYEGSSVEPYEPQFYSFSFGVCLISDPIDTIHYITYDSRYLTDEQRKAILRFLISRKVWTFNVKYEIGVSENITGEFIELEDTYCLFKPLGRQFWGLKEGSTKLLEGVEDWSEDTWGCVKLLQTLKKYVKKQYTDKIVKNKEYRPIAKYLAYGDLKGAVAYTYTQADEDLMKYEKSVMAKVRDYMDILSPQCVLKAVYDLDDYDINLSALPVKMVGEYCAMDTICTALLKTKLWPLAKEQYHIYLKQSYLAATMARYGIYWDYEKSIELENYYLKECLKYYKQLISIPDFVIEGIEPEDISRGLHATHKSEIKDKIFNPASTKDTVIKSFYDSLFRSNKFNSAMIAFQLFKYLQSIKDLTFDEVDPDGKVIIDEELNQPKKYHLCTKIRWDNINEILIKTKAWILENSDKDGLNEFVKAVNKVRSIENWYCGSLRADMIEGMFNALTQCAGSDPSVLYEDMDWEFQMIFNFKMIKKMEKCLTTYITGKKVGRENVVYATFPKDNVTEVPKRVLEDVDGAKHNFFIANCRECGTITRRFQAGFHCLSKDTKISLTNGTHIKIDEIYNNPNKKYKTFTYKDGEIIEEYIKEVHLSGYSYEMIELTLENGNTIECTPNHKFLMYSKLYNEAQYIDKNEFILGVNNTPIKVIDVKYKKYKKSIPVYDLTMPEDTPCFALEAGVISHNTIPWNSELRELIQPRNSEYIMVHWDFSQSEVRVLAALAKESTLLKAFEDGIDIHRYVASEVFGLPFDKVTTELRKFAKGCTFAILYGQTIENFAIENLNGNFAQAQEIFNKFFTRFPGIKIWIEKAHKDILEKGYVTTLFNDIIYVPYNPNKQSSVNKALREGQNFGPQNASSCIAGMAIWDLWKAVQRVKLLAIPGIFTHDSSDWELYIPHIIHFMKLSEHCAVTKVKKDWGIPMKIDFEIGTNQNAMMEVKNPIFNGNDEVTFEFEMCELFYDDLINQFKKYWNVTIDIHKEELKTEPLKNLFVADRGYSRYIGRELKFYEGNIKLVRK